MVDLVILEMSRGFGISIRVVKKGLIWWWNWYVFNKNGNFHRGWGFNLGKWWRIKRVNHGWEHSVCDFIKWYGYNNIIKLIFEWWGGKMNSMLMKNIPKCENFLCIKFIYIISFLPKGIANKNAPTSTYVKFVYGCEVGCMA